MIKKHFLPVIFLMLLSNTIFSQMIANLLDTIPACKNTSVQLSPTVVANGTTGTPNYIDTFWTPTTGLSNPNIINPQFH